MTQFNEELLASLQEVYETSGEVDYTAHPHHVDRQLTVLSRAGHASFAEVVTSMDISGPTLLDFDHNNISEEMAQLLWILEVRNNFPAILEALHSQATMAAKIVKLEEAVSELLRLLGEKDNSIRSALKAYSLLGGKPNGY